MSFASVLSRVSPIVPSSLLPSRRDLIGVAMTLGLTLAALGVFVGPLLTTADALPPVAGDFFFCGFMVKGILTQGWYPFASPQFGLPFGFDSFAFPSTDALNFGVIKLIGLFSHDWFKVTKAFYVSSFFIAAALGYLAMRVAGIRRLLSVCAAVLYACAPYPFLRVNHLFLASTLTVPLAFMCLLFVWNGARWPTANPRQPRIVAFSWFVIALVAIGLSGLYYAVFTCVFLAVVGVATAWRSRRIRLILPAAMGTACIGLVLIAQLLPSIVQRRTEGENFSMWKRSFEQTEVAGWKIAQALLPVQGHRIDAFAAIEQRYASSAPLVNENRSSGLGLLASAGFLLSLVHLIGRGVQRRDDSVADLSALCGLLNLSGVLYATVGGFAVLFSLLVFPEIRGVNRISIFLSFFSLAFVALRVQLAARRRPRLAAILGQLALLATALALADQIPRIDMDTSVKHIRLDRAFYNLVAGRLQAGTAVFQLPYHPFPEGGNQGAFEDYENVKAPLFAPGLGWSQPTFRGREGDLWNREVATLPVERMIAETSQAGFGALLVDFRGYPGQAERLKSELVKALGAPLLEEAFPARAVWALPRPAGSPRRPDPLSTFVRDTDSETPGSSDGIACNLDMFNDGPMQPNIGTRFGRRYVLAGWALSKSDPLFNQRLVATGASGRWVANIHTQLRRADVGIAFPGTTDYAGLLVYFVPNGMPAGDYRLSLAADAGGRHLECPTPAVLSVAP